MRPAADDGRPEQQRAGMRHERGQEGAGREVRQDGRVGQPADHDDGGQRGEGEPAWPAARPASDPDPEQGGKGELDRAKGRVVAHQADLEAGVDDQQPAALHGGLQDGQPGRPEVKPS